MGADSQVLPTGAESLEREHPLEEYLSEVISQMRFCVRDLHLHARFQHLSFLLR